MKSQKEKCACCLPISLGIKLIGAIDVVLLLLGILTFDIVYIWFYTQTTLLFLYMLYKDS